MENFNFKRAKINIKKKSNKYKKIKKETTYNNSINNKKINSNKFNNNIQNYNNINNNSNCIITNTLKESEKELIKVFWPDYINQTKSLASMIKEKEYYKKLNSNWYKFYYN